MTGAGDAFVLIATMTQCPPVAGRRIRRPRLIARLQRGAEARLVVIKAPAGYGKTTLAVEWSEILQASGQRTAWLRAEREVNETSVFLLYLVSTLEHACPGAGRRALEMMSERALPPTHAVLTALVNALVESGEELCLFIDDYHLVEAEEVHLIVRFLLQHAPRHFHVVLTTREEPPLQLSALRGRGEVCEIDMGEMRFSLEETGRLLDAEELLNLDEGTVSVLQRETGGWAAALRMACSSILAGVEPARSLYSRPGGGHTVEAYLTETLARLPAEVYEFMLASSILKSLSPEICDEVIGMTGSEAILESLFQRYQLINVDTGSASTYSYHPLIAEYLQQRQNRQAPEKSRELHRRAANWFFRHERMGEAIRHAVAADERELAAAWTERCAMGMIKEGNVRTVLSWRQWLPRELMRKQLPLRVALGWSLMLAAQRDDARQWLAAIETDIAAGAPDPESRFARECLAIRTALLGHSDDGEGALAAGLRYMEAPLGDPWINNVVGNTIFFGYLLAGRHDLVDQLSWQQVDGAGSVRETVAQVFRLSLSGLSYSQRLKFREAEACYQQASAIAIRDRGPTSTMAAIPATLLAHQWYETNQIDAAESLISNRLDGVNATGFLDCELRAYIVLARIAYRKKDNALAFQLLDRAEAVAAVEQWPRMLAALLVERLRLYLDAGDTGAAGICLTRLEKLAEKERGKVSHVVAYRHLAQAFMDIRAGRCALVPAALEPLWSAAMKSENLHFASYLGTLQAVALFADRRPDAGLARFAEVLAIAAPARLIRSIVDCGPEVGSLLSAARRNVVAGSGGGQMADYLSQLAKAFDASWDGATVRSLAGTDQAVPLTPREGEVLRLIADGQSNKRIAALMAVSPETVKSHVKNIFMKFGVDNRMQAVTLGRRLGLFP